LLASAQETCQTLSIRRGLIRRVDKESEMQHSSHEQPIDERGESGADGPRGIDERGESGGAESDRGWDLIQLDWSTRENARPGRFTRRLLGLLRRARACDRRP
jgi:hypothetical protein